MSSVTLTLPEPLLRVLETAAQNKGITLSEYVLAALTRHVSTTYRVEAVPEEQRERDEQEFAALLQRLGTASEEEIERALDEAEPGEWEPELTPEIVARFEEKLKIARESRG
jgi:hypothetical protein